MRRTERSPAQVECWADGSPCLVRWNGRRQPVTVLFSSWRVESRWWDKPVRRDYYKALLEDSSAVLMTHDHLAGVWFVGWLYG